MKKFFTILGIALLMSFVGKSQSFNLQIDSLRIYPHTPSTADSILLVVYGHCNYQVQLENPMAVMTSPNGDSALVTGCYLVSQVQGATLIYDSALISVNGPVGMRNVQWVLQYNASWWTACDGIISQGSMNYSVSPVGIAAPVAESPVVNWDVASSSLSFSGFNGPLIIDIYDVNGKAMRMSEINSSDQMVTIAGLRPGVYLAWIRDEKGQSVRQKLIVQ